jgi:predicted unusual protein kinase regulating ubiquinone biosynthesis (AarF/ABC1/UbiB family)
MELLKNDLNIIFGITDFVSKIWGFSWLKIPITYNEFLKVIIEQADFRIEGNNLRKFKDNFDSL